MLDASPAPASSSSLACGTNEAQSRPPSDFNILWDEALRRYRTETKRDLLELPIAKAYPSRPSNADEIMNVFEQQNTSFKTFRSGGRGIRGVLKSTVDLILLIKAATDGAAVSIACYIPPRLSP